jgi:hypothetical protein
MNPYKMAGNFFGCLMFVLFFAYERHETDTPVRDRSCRERLFLRALILCCGEKIAHIGGLCLGRLAP